MEIEDQPVDRPDKLNEEAKGLVYTAKLCNQAGQHRFMLDSMKKVIGLGYPLTDEERNLLAHAYVSNLSKLRSAWRMAMQKASEESKVIEDPKTLVGVREASEENRIVVDHYRRMIVIPKYKEACEDLVKVVRGIVIPVEERFLMRRARLAGGSRTARPVNEAMVFYKKLLADTYRYLGEIAEDKEELEAAAESAEGAYNDAKKAAEKVLGPSHPLRLGVYLNMSIFYYDVMEKPDRACKIASAAFREGTAEIDSMTDEKLAADSSAVLLYLRDNLRLWATRQMKLVEDEEARKEARVQRRVLVTQQVDEEERIRMEERVKAATEAHLERARQTRK